MNGKLGSLSAPVYFINQRDDKYPTGYYILAPYSEFQTPEGWLRYTADTLAEVDRLQKILLCQELERARREHIHESVVMDPLRKIVRDRLYARMTSSESSEFEKDFIREYMKLRDDKRRKHADRFYHRNLFLHAREMDARPGRKDNEEIANTDFLEVT